MKWLKRLFLVFLVCWLSLEEIAFAANSAELRIRPLDTNLVLSILGDARFDYRIQSSTNLVNWTTLVTTNPPAMPFLWTDPDQGDFDRRFYRAQLLP